MTHNPTSIFPPLRCFLEEEKKKKCSQITKEQKTKEIIHIFQSRGATNEESMFYYLR